MSPFRRSAPLAAAALALVPAAVRADATVVTQTQVENLPGASGAKRAARTTTSVSAAVVSGSRRGSARITTYYRNGASRTETPDGATIVTPERVYLIDDAKKTYQAVSKAKMADTANPFLAMLQMKTDAKAIPGGKTQVILGKPARNWIVTATVRMTLPAMGALGGQDGATAKPQTMTIRVRTEMWVTEAVDIGAGAAAMGMGDAAPGAGFMKPMVDKMKEIKGLPLRVTMTQTMEGAMMPAAMKSKPVTIRTEVVSIDEKPLPASLFLPPKGYRQVPYTPPMMPGMPGGGMPGGRP